MEYTMRCKKCAKEFKVEVTDMRVPGGKEKEEIYCPYCKELNGYEVTSGFVYTSKLENKNQETEMSEKVRNS